MDRAFFERTGLFLATFGFAAATIHQAYLGPERQPLLMALFAIACVVSLVGLLRREKMV